MGVGTPAHEVSARDASCVRCTRVCRGADSSLTRRERASALGGALPVVGDVCAAGPTRWVERVPAGRVGAAG